MFLWIDFVHELTKEEQREITKFRDVFAVLLLHGLAEGGRESGEPVRRGRRRL